MGALLDEAEALAEVAGDQRRLGRALTYKVIQFWLAAGNFTLALRTGLRALAIGQGQADVPIQVVVNGYLGGVHVGRGDCREAVRHCEAAIAMIPEHLVQERFGQTIIQSSYARTTLAIALGALGRFGEAFGHLREATRIAEDAGQAYTLLFPLVGLGILKLDQGDFAGAIAPLERGLELCRAREVPLWLHECAWPLGAAYHWTGRGAEGIALMEEAARDIADRNVRWSWWAGRVGALGRAYLLAGRLGDATRIADVELAEARLREARLVEGHLLRLLGDVAAHPDRFEADIAETHYRRAQALAQELGLRPLLAHCHLGLGALYRRAGKRQDALEHLTTAVTMFGEMDMRYWRAPADRMLNELT